LQGQKKETPMKININADVGESFGRYTIGNDEELIGLIGSASIACGMHAGDPSVMARTIDIAVKTGASIGAHPGFDDRWGFGRRQIDMNPKDLENLVTYQIGALQGIANGRGVKVTHVKPHGALNNMAIEDREYAMAIGRGIKAADKDLIYVANFGTAMHRAGLELGLVVAREFYADRNYDDDGNIISRKFERAMIKDPAVAAEHIVRAVTEGHVISVSGKKIEVAVDSICIHGDEPTAVPVAKAIRKALTDAGCEIVPLPALGLPRGVN
jgi:5-oxoprolinase (ATP-hydrolysing) subunit A